MLQIRKVTRAIVNNLLGVVGLQVVRRRLPVAGYEEYIQEALEGVEHPLVLDIGANEGQSAVQILEVRPDAEIHSFEPSPEIYERLRNKIHAPGFKAHNLALGEANGVGKFHLFPASQTNSFLEPAAGTAQVAPYLNRGFETIEVPVRRLDDYLQEHQLLRQIDYLKIDAQGFENRVLRGAPVALRRTRYLMIEVNFNQVYKGSCLVDEICYLLYGHGFRLQKTVGYLIGERLDELLSSDFFFVRG